MKHSFYIVFCLGLLEYIFGVEETMMKHRKFHKVAPAQAKERPLNLDINDAKVYWQGWVKYYHYTNDTHYKKPPSLFQNNAFFNQRIQKDKLAEKDQFGLLHIPNKASFFMVLYNNSISVFSDRKSQTRNLIDSLKVSYIDVVPEDDVLHGGIRDDGNFPFGYCIEIVAHIPSSFTVKPIPGSGSAETWIICTSKNEEKDVLLSTLIKLKVKHQRLENNGVKIMSSNKNDVIQAPKALGSLLANPDSSKLNDRSGLGSLTDGYWVLLQDWTSCSQKCGNGTSYQQWMCVPPKNGGKPCQGEAIRKKTCNPQPCPSVNALISLVSVASNPGTTAKKLELAPRPIVKAGLFSNRPQRYEKCLVKENDAFLLSHVQGVVDPIRKPIRIIMNNSTITVYNDDTYSEMEHSWKLENTKFSIAQETCCFNLEDSSRKASICGYKQYCGPAGQNTWVSGWSRDFSLFKSTCKVDVSEVGTPNAVVISDDINNEINKKSSEIIEEVKIYYNFIGSK